MRKLLVSVALAVAVNVAAPVPARANIAWWDYLEQLSGPGPFYKRGPLVIFTIDSAVACRLAQPQDGGKQWTFLSRECVLEPPRRGPRRVMDFIAVRLGATATDDQQPLFSDRPDELRGKVTAWTLEAKFTRRLDAALTLAAGGGIIFFTGDTIDRTVVRGTLTPLSVLFTPIGLAHRNDPQKFDGIIGLRFEEIAILGGIAARDFNAKSTSPFQSDNIDLVRRFSVTVDIAPFLFPRSR